MNVESSQCQNQDSFFQGNAAKYSSPNISPNLKLLPDLEDLSKDFSFLLDSSFMTDIQLECGDYIIAAHKAILAARSPVFSKVMEREVDECSNITVEIKDIEPFVLREFLGYLYSGKISVDLSEDMLCKLYTASENYYVQGLKKLCSCCMFRNLNAENFSKFLILAYEHNDSALVVSIAGFIAERPELLISDNWIKFSDEFPRLANEIYRTHMVNVLGKKCSYINLNDGLKDN